MQGKWAKHRTMESFLCSLFNPRVSPQGGLNIYTDQLFSKIWSVCVYVCVGDLFSGSDS